MGKIKDLIKENNKKAFKQKIKEFFNYLKRPSFFLPFFITWLLFQTPLIVSVILYFVTKENKYLIFATSYYALTAPPLPIPVVPISIAVGLAVERTHNKIIKKRKNKKNDKCREKQDI